MALRVYNTLTRQKEHSRPSQPGKVGMYVCGPTVYKPSHVGHMVGPVIFDTVKRYLTYLGYQVTFVVNITDVDDKLINEAAKQNTTVTELAERITADYVDNLNGSTSPASTTCRGPREHIADIIEIIQGLIDKGLAYPAGGDVYFDVTRTRITASCATAIRSSWRPGPASRSATRSATPATSPCGRRPSRASRRGTARGARAGPAGTSNAPP